MNKFSEYIKYLAENHQAIRHEDNVHVHFLSSDDSKHTCIDSELCYPAVIIDKGVGYNFSGSAVAYFRDNIYQLFIVQHVHDTSDCSEINSALDECSGILDDFLRRIMADRNISEYRFLKTFNLVDVEVEYIQNVDNSQYGVLALIPLPESYNHVLCYNPFLK